MRLAALQTLLRAIGDERMQDMPRMLVRPANFLARNVRLSAIPFLLFLFVVGADAQHAAAASGLFSDLSGSWSGSGSIKLLSGASERIRCRATYVVANAGSSLQQSLICASDSYKFNVKSNLTYKSEAGVITGSWAETSYNTVGTFSGRFRGDQIRATIKGDDFLAHMTVVTRGARQSVSIRSPGGAVSSVAISLSRGSKQTALK